MNILLNEQSATLAYEPLLAALGILACCAVIYLAVKGKLRNWFLR